jgi:hypothetical protein
MMWLWDTREKPLTFAGWMTFWVYPNNLGIKDARLPDGKRIKIEFTIEESPSHGAKNAP